LYSRNTIGGTQQWEIIVKGNGFFVREGLVNGKLTESKPTIVSGKNIDKINETSIEEQAFLEAKRKWDKKIEKGYHENIDDIDNESKYFEPMLAKKYIDRKDTIVFPVLVSSKIDGCRMIVSKNGLHTRNGKEFISCPHIFEILKPIFNKHPNWIIDGEIYSHDIPFENIMSLVRKTKPTQEDLKESKLITQLWIFDGVTDDRNLGFEERFKIIKDEIIKIIGKNKSLKFIDNIKINSHNEIQKYHDEFVKQGFEGLMLRIPNSIYENKRSSNLLKYKMFLDEEFKIIDIEEGSGNRSGMAGNLMLEMKNKKTFCSSIKGGEDYYRELLKNKSKIIGKLATIRYQNLSEDGIPRFPICIDINRGDL
jgi:DNA ligase-1